MHRTIIDRIGRRKKTPRVVEADVLTRSRRRCALCVGLDGDFRKKIGQIDHLDSNPANSALDNLVFLCLEHHAQKSSKSAQSKGFTVLEIKEYRDRLYSRLRAGTAEPTDRIMDSWNDLKHAFKMLGERHQVKVDWKSFRVAAVDLETAGVITHQLADRIRELQELRQRACYESDLDAQAQYEQQFVDGAKEIFEVLKRL